MKVLGYEFQGPLGSFYAVPAAYIIVRRQIFRLVDAGETDNLDERMSNHERKPCWVLHSNPYGYDIYALVVQDEDKRREIETSIRDYYDPPCGKE